MYKQFAHVAVSSLANADKLLLSAGGIFPRHEAQPRSEIAGLLELPTVANGGEQCRRTQRSDSGDRHESSCDILAIGNRLDLACDVTNPLLQLVQVRKQVCEQLTHRRRKVV